MNRRILEVLKNNRGKFVSGEDLSKELNVTRAAVWKHINYFKDRGYIIESMPKRGYKLISSPDLLTGEELWYRLNTTFMGRSVRHFDTLESTNLYAKQIGDSCPDGTVVTCESQTAGRGRLGREWKGTKGGLYMSVVLKPQISIFEAAKLTQVCAAAVSKALELSYIDTEIKWPNDLLIKGKKMCGILTEMNSEINKVNYVVIGIGINVNNELSDFDEEVAKIATSLLTETGHGHNRSDIAANVLNIFEKYYEEFINKGNYELSLDVCRQKSSVLGKDINIVRPGGLSVRAKALDIGSEGELIVAYEDGTTEGIVSGEVSVRIAK